MVCQNISWKISGNANRVKFSLTIGKKRGHIYREEERLVVLLQILGVYQIPLFDDMGVLFTKGIKRSMALVRFSSKNPFLRQMAERISVKWRNCRRIL